jgi:hypothetical protein
VSNGETQGRQEVAFVGESKAVYREGQEGTDDGLVKEASLEEALHNLAVVAKHGGVEKIRVVSIEITPGNPHIKEVSAVGTPP